MDMMMHSQPCRLMSIHRVSHAWIMLAGLLSPADQCKSLSDSRSHASTEDHACSSACLIICILVACGCTVQQYPGPENTSGAGCFAERLEPSTKRPRRKSDRQRFFCRELFIGHSAKALPSARRSAKREIKKYKKNLIFFNQGSRKSWYFLP
jgi:hypothetical protein